MTKAGFSEFSYGYAVTEDIASSAPRRIAPIFPSLTEEGKTGGGYDLKLDLPGFPMFLQFKLSDWMVRPYATEAKSGYLQNPFYRIPLRPLKESQQHQLLLDLELAANDVYYVAPAFHLDTELNSVYQSHQVADRSVFIMPSDIGPLPDSDQHYLSFQNDQSTFGYLFSKSPQKVKIRRWGQVSEASLARVKQTTKSQKRLADVLNTIEQSMFETLERRFREKEVEWKAISHAREREEQPRRIASLSQVFFDCTLFIVQVREQ